MPAYTIGLRTIATGTVATTNGSPVVTLSGGGSPTTAWQTVSGSQTFPAFGAGDWIQIGTAAPVMIASADSATQLTLVNNWGASASGQTYKIWVTTGVDSSVVAALLDSFLNLGAQANPFTNLIFSGNQRLLRAEASGTDILLKIGAQALAGVVQTSDLSALVTAIKIDSTGKVTFPLGAPDIIKPNFLINGGTNIIQRGSSWSATGYMADRWYGTVTGTVTVDSNSTVPTGARRSLRATMGAVSSGVVYWQALEQNDVIALRGKRLCFSLWARYATSFTGNIRLKVQSGDTADVLTTGIWTDLTPVSPTTGLLALTTAYQQVYVTVDVPTTALGLRVQIDCDSALASGAQWYFSLAKLEEGSVPSPWVPEPAGMELAKCQRFFQKSYPALTNPAAVSTLGQIVQRAPVAAANMTLAQIRFSPAMRATPTITMYNPNDGNTTNPIRKTNATAADMAASTETGIGETGFSVRNTSTPAVADTLTMHWTANAELA